MVDTPSAILLLRLQATGGNNNLWGGYLNTALSTLEQASKGYQTLAVTGSTTITWSQYSTGNTGQCAFLLLIGTLASAATLTFPTYQNYLKVKNTAGATVTILCSGGTGVAIPNNAVVDLYCDGTTDYKNAADTLGQTYTPANTYDIALWGAVQTAIANASLPGTPGTVRNSGTDTISDYLSSKLTVNATFTGITGSMSLSTVNLGGKEKRSINFSITVDPLYPFFLLNRGS